MLLSECSIIYALSVYTLLNSLMLSVWQRAAVDVCPVSARRRQMQSNLSRARSSSNRSRQQFMNETDA